LAFWFHPTNPLSGYNRTKKRHEPFNDITGRRIPIPLKTTLRQKAYRAIKNKIIYFELKPGEKILESKIAQSLKLGRVPVREALTMLESERLITKTKGYGYIVTQLNDSEIEDFLTIRTILEKVGAAMLIERITPADIRKIKKHVEKATEIYQGWDLKQIIESDTKFHDLLYRATHSDAFYQTISTLLDKTIMMRAAALQSQKGRISSLHDHIEIAKAIEKKDLELLQRLIHEHLQFAPRYYESMRPLLFP
jgi:DNA-binding GntR family transcriptional regulator